MLIQKEALGHLSNDDPSQAKGVAKESPSRRTVKVPGEVLELERRPIP